MVRIGLSDGALFSLKTVYLPPPYQDDDFWTIGREISFFEAGELRFAAACYRAERAALQLIARAEQTSRGLSRKLETRGHGGICVRAVLAHFVDRELVSDRRYAERWLHSRLNRSAGKVPSPRRLLASLAARGIDRAASQAALNECLDFEAELALLTRYIEKNRLPVKPDYLKSKLKFEGFSPSVLSHFLENNN